MATSHLHAETLQTELCKLLKIKYPVMVAGMAGVTGPELVAAASNSGGIGTIGAIGLSPEGLRALILATKARLAHPGLPFGVDLLLPKVGAGAKKTNKDYTNGKLSELLDIVIELEVPLFVCAVGVPPKSACDRLHAHGVVVMNMVGDPRHCSKAVKAGCDVICAQGTEGGGHTGQIATSVLIPQCVEKVQGCVNHFGSPVLVVAAGGIYNGAGLAASLAFGAAGVWCGTAFLAAEECNVEQGYQDKVLTSSSADTVVQRFYSGRTMRVIRNDWVTGWEKKQSEADELLAAGVLPSMVDMGDEDSGLEASHAVGALLFPDGNLVDRKAQSATFNPAFAPMLAGQAIGPITSIRPVAEIIQQMVREAIAAVRRSATLVARL